MNYIEFEMDGHLYCGKRDFCRKAFDKNALGKKIDVIILIDEKVPPFYEYKGIITRINTDSIYLDGFMLGISKELEVL